MKLETNLSFLSQTSLSLGEAESGDRAIQQPAPDGEEKLIKIQPSRGNFFSRVSLDCVGS